MSTSDRELLELAARAAGIDFEFCRIELGGALLLSRKWWNPLTDDGDALRLAVKLQLDIEFIDACDTVYVSNKKADVVVTVAIGDLEIRRAIVRAAAEIGRLMP